MNDMRWMELFLVKSSTGPPVAVNQTTIPSSDLSTMGDSVIYTRENHFITVNCARSNTRCVCSL